MVFMVQHKERAKLPRSQKRLEGSDMFRVKLSGQIHCVM